MKSPVFLLKEHRPKLPHTSYHTGRTQGGGKPQQLSQRKVLRGVVGVGVTPGALDDKLVINGPSVLLNVSKSLSLELLISPQQSHFSSHNVTSSSHSQESLERI